MLSSQVWWCLPLILAFVRQRQVEPCELKAILLYIVRSQGYTERSCLSICVFPDSVCWCSQIDEVLPALKKFLFAEDRDCYRKPQLAQMQTTDHVVPNPSWYAYNTTPLSKAQGTSWERG